MALQALDQLSGARLSSSVGEPARALRGGLGDTPFRMALAQDLPAILPDQEARRAWLAAAAHQTSALATLVGSAASGMPLPPARRAALVSTLDPKQRQLYATTQAIAG